MSAILGFIGIGILCALDSANTTAKSKEKCRQLVDQGDFLKRDYERNSMVFQDYYMDWRVGEGKFVPKEYHEYFRRNKKAAEEYAMAQTSAQLVKEGLAPIFNVTTYNKYTFDPFSRFNYLFKEKIEIFNDTGKCYF